MDGSPTDWRRSTWSSTYTASTVVLVLLAGSTALGQETASSARLGRPPTAAELRDVIVAPDGTDLPDGQGSAIEGAQVYERRGCSVCHGPTGTEGPSLALIGGEVTSFSNYWPIVHWPFAPSIWDYIYRVMPYDRPGILTVDETYAVTAFLLHRNGIIAEGDVMDQDSLPEVMMPHRDDYVPPASWTPQTRRGFRIPPEQ